MTERFSIAALVLAFQLASSVSFAAPPAVKVPPVDFKPAQVERLMLSNGVVVYLKEDHELPTFDMTMRMKTSPADTPEWDAFGFLGTVWRAGGTKTRKPEALNEELERRAISIETGVDEESATVSLSCLSKNIGEGIDVFSDVLFNPALDETQLVIAKGKALEGIRRKNDTPAQISRRAFRDVTYGKSHIYAYEPTEKSVARVTRKTLADLHRKILSPEQAMICVSGDFNKTDLLAQLEQYFSSWTATGRSVLPYDYSVKNASPSRIFVVDKDFNQSRVTVARVGVARHTPDHFALELGDYILGGGGPSRLFGEVRSRLGLAYVVGSFVQEPAGPGLLGVVCQTKSASTVKAIEAINAELTKFSTTLVTPDELRLAKDASINSYVFGFDSPWDLVNARASNEFFGFPPDYPDTYTERLDSIGREDIQRVGKKYYGPANMKILVVGNEKNFDAPLDSLGNVVHIPISEIE